VARIIKRIIRFAPQVSIKDLKTIRLLDNDRYSRGFGCYFKKEKEIRIFVKEIIGWQPWILKKTLIFPYLTIAVTLGHEIDHHVNRDNEKIDRENSAKINALKNVYPSFGIFKPPVKIILCAFKLVGKKNGKQCRA
jgi:hypothetical protein